MTEQQWWIITPAINTDDTIFLKLFQNLHQQVLKCLLGVEIDFGYVSIPFTLKTF